MRFPHSQDFAVVVMPFDLFCFVFILEKKKKKKKIQHNQKVFLTTVLSKVKTSGLNLNVVSARPPPHS